MRKLMDLGLIALAVGAILAVIGYNLGTVFLKAALLAFGN